MKPDEKLIGKQLKIEKNTLLTNGSSYGAPVGTTVTILGVSNGNFRRGEKREYYDVESYFGKGYVYVDEIEHITSIEEMEEEITRKYEEINLLQTKIDFVNQYGIEIYDQTEFEVFQVLRTLGIEDVEKAREIIRIIK